MPTAWISASQPCQHLFSLVRFGTRLGPGRPLEAGESMTLDSRLDSDQIFKTYIRQFYIHILQAIYLYKYCLYSKVHKYTGTWILNNLLPSVAGPPTMSHAQSIFLRTPFAACWRISWAFVSNWLPSCCCKPIDFEATGCWTVIANTAAWCLRSQKWSSEPPVNSTIHLGQLRPPTTTALFPDCVAA